MTRSQKILLVALAAAVAAAALIVFSLLRGPGQQPPAPAANATAERAYQREIPFRPEEPGNATLAGNATAANATAEAPASPPEDSVVKPEFLSDLAAVLAQTYHPAGTRHNPGARPMTTAGFRKLNMRYGVELIGLAHASPDLEQARPAVFDYLLNPIVLRAVFDLYADRFVSGLAEAGRSQEREFGSEAKGFAARPLSDAETAEMLRLYARQARDLGTCFRAFAERRDLSTAVARMMEAAQRVSAAYAAYKDQEAQNAPRQAREAQAEEIKRSIAERERLRQGLLAGIMPGGNAAKAFSLSEGDVLDVSGWVYRRLRVSPERINALGAMASLLPELAARLEAAAEAPPAPPAQAQ